MTTRFASLRNLLSGTSALASPAASLDAEDEAGAEGGIPAEDEQEPVENEDAGDPPADGGVGEDGDEPGADAPPAAAQSADYQAGVDAANRRWAGIILNDACRANLELAAELAVDTNLSAERIGHLCSIERPSSNQGRTLLSTTPKPNIGPAAGEADGGDDGKTAAKKAVAGVNKRRNVKKGA